MTAVGTSADPSAPEVLSRLAAIRDRREAATVGPWVQEEHSNALVAPALGLSADGVRMQAVAEEVYAHGDRQFIVHASDDVAFLLDLVERLTV